MMKITFRWNETEGEGSPSATDQKRLLDAAASGDIAALDFAKDVMHDATNLYNRALGAFRADRAPL